MRFEATSCPAVLSKRANWEVTKTQTKNTTITLKELQELEEHASSSTSLAEFNQSGLYSWAVPEQKAQGIFPKQHLKAFDRWHRWQFFCPASEKLIWAVLKALYLLNTRHCTSLSNIICWSVVVKTSSCGVLCSSGNRVIRELKENMALHRCFWISLINFDRICQKKSKIV